MTMNDFSIWNVVYIVLIVIGFVALYCVICYWENRPWISWYDPEKTKQRTGRWTKKEVSTEVVEEWQSAQCSVCGKWHTTPYMYYFSHYDYCPSCGAKMEEGD